MIDEKLYSRQLYVLGHEAMTKMMESRVLVIGVDGLGVEISKNLVLAGIKGLSIIDQTLGSVQDLSSQYYLDQDCIGRPKDISTIDKLRDLNKNVQIRIEPKLTHNVMEQYNVIVAVNLPLHKQIEINEYTHHKGIRFVSANIHGVFGSVFCDFGEDGFVIQDTNGEDPSSGLVSYISGDGMVYCIDDHRHNLEDGDFVTFRNILGTSRLNGCEPRRVQVNDPYSFSIGDIGGMETKGGEFVQVKQPKRVAFRSLKESVQDPQIVVSDFEKVERGKLIHLGFQALSEYEKQHSEYPENLDQVIESISGKITMDPGSRGVIRQLVIGSTVQLPFMAAIIGGLASQEVLKAVSHKFSPIQQHFYFDALETLPCDCWKTGSCVEDCVFNIGVSTLESSRYSPIAKMYGQVLFEKIRNANVFLVGTGAIGCELAKIWMCLGLGTGPHGCLYLTDMDTIEWSNLNRQFLFRDHDISKHKSRVAEAAIQKMNEDYHGHIVAYEEKVGPETENVFNAEFYQNIDIIVNALDNVEARQYMDTKGVLYEKPLVESGTLGTKCHTQVVVPYLTESYSSSQDPPEKSFPFCTLKNFPNSIEHTIQWALDLFHGTFNSSPDLANQYLESPKEFVDNLLESVSSKASTLENIYKILRLERPTTVDECIKWARLWFDELFCNNIKQLLFNFPPDSMTSSGVPFWSGPKKCPVPLKFDLSSSEHLNFVVHAANLRSHLYGLEDGVTSDAVKRTLESFQAPEFVPKQGVEIQVSDLEPVSEDEPSDKTLEHLEQLSRDKDLLGNRLHTIKLEKDNDDNGHIDFITAAANLRAHNYSITPGSRHQIKAIAGKIIPAIATVTAFVAGLVSVEVVKLVRDFVRHGPQPIKRDAAVYKNSFSNLALPFFAFSEPIRASRYGKTEWTLWHRFNVPGNMTLHELIESTMENHSLEITMLSHERSVLYGFVRQKQELEKRKKMSIRELVEHVGARKIDPHMRFIVLEMLACDKEGRDVETPFILVRLESQ